jgi:tRNA-Thr(GGU) m(6)t(6)A37 methyltransferase TsaA
MATVSVRYIVDDVDASIAFYRDNLGFTEIMHPAPTFAMLSLGDLRLVLTAPGGGPGGGQAMPDGTLPAPGGWNRFTIEVPDLALAVSRLRANGVQFRNEIVTGAGGKQILAEDPSGNPVELFEPLVPEARLSNEVRPIGWVESTLTDIAEAPNQGYQGAPSAWLNIEPQLAEAIRDLHAGENVIVLSWLDRALRDELSTVPGDNPGSPPLGVFSTRSPNRPNPIGLHRVQIIATEGLRLHVSPLEAVDGTPILDIKPVLDRTAER